MNMRRLFLLSGFFSIVLLFLLACATSTPTPTTKVGPVPAPSTPKASSQLPTTPATKPPASAVSFAGKTITMIVAANAGGGTDIVARVYAKYLSRFLPGSPSVIVRNMPGGNYMIGANYAYASKPDGLTLFAASGAVQLAQLVGVSAAKYDLFKMPLLIGTASGGVFYMKTGIIDKPEDITKAKGVIYGGTAGGSSYLFIPAKELLGMATDKVVTAYSGSSETRRAFFSGEINLSYVSTPSYVETIASSVAKGEVMILFESGRLDEKADLLKSYGLPAQTLTVKELYEKLNGKPPSGVVWDAYKAALVGALQYDAPLYLVPGTPSGVIQAYWRACENMIKDAEFRKVADPLVGGEVARWSAGEPYDKQFKQNFKVDPQVRDWLRSALPKYGMVVE